MGKLFKNRTVGFYAGLGAAAFAIITAIVYTVLNTVDNQFFILVMILLLLGAVTGIANIFVNNNFYNCFLYLTAGLLYGSAFGVYIGSSFANAFNSLIGQAFHNVGYFVVLCVMFGIVSLVSVVSCFMPDARKK